MTSPLHQPRGDHADARVAPRVIVLPDVGRDTTLTEEFGEHLPIETVERAVAAARHALERSHQPATADAVKRLARQYLQSRVANLAGRRR